MLFSPCSALLNSAGALIFESGSASSPYHTDFNLLLMKPLVPGASWGTSFNLWCCLLLFTWTEPAKILCFPPLHTPQLLSFTEPIRLCYTREDLLNTSSFMKLGALRKEQTTEYEQWVLKSLAKFCLLAHTINFCTVLFEPMHLKPDFFSLETLSELCAIIWK